MIVNRQRISNPRLGYAFAALNALISGIAVYVNSLGVSLFPDATLYTTLKNAVVGLALLLPLFFFAATRQEYRRLSRRQWANLLLLALIGGSIPYVLFFQGLQMTTAVTGALLNHTQFVLVAIMAAILIGERFGPAVWFGLLALFIGSSLGTNVSAVRFDQGAILVALSTILFAASAVLAKYLLRDLSPLTVMTAKMSLGSAGLIAYVIVTGRWAAIPALSVNQWGFVLITGLILLAFTVTLFLGLRHASATAVTAIGAAAPIITTLLVALGTQKLALSAVDGLGLCLMGAGAAVIYIAGRRQEQRRRQLPAHEAVL